MFRFFRKCEYSLLCVVMNTLTAHKRKGLLVYMRYNSINSNRNGDTYDSKMTAKG